MTRMKFSVGQHSHLSKRQLSWIVFLSVFELGFGDEASLHDIYARAVALGFELCPAEVGPALRLNYLDQPPGDFLHIAMKPVAKYNGR